METRNKAIPAVYLFLEENSKILIARRCNTGYQDGMYHVPSGHVEEGELPKAAMIREAKEEIGISLLPEDLQFAHVLYRVKHDQTDNRVDFFFHAGKWTGQAAIKEPNKCDNLRWVRMTELPENMSPEIREVIESMLNCNFFSEL